MVVEIGLVSVFIWLVGSALFCFVYFVIIKCGGWVVKYQSE